MPSLCFTQCNLTPLSPLKHGDVLAAAAAAVHVSAATLSAPPLLMSCLCICPHCVSPNVTCVSPLRLGDALAAAPASVHVSAATPSAHPPFYCPVSALPSLCFIQCHLTCVSPLRHGNVLAAAAAAVHVSAAATRASPCPCIGVRHDPSPSRQPPGHSCRCVCAD